MASSRELLCCHSYLRAFVSAMPSASDPSPTLPSSCHSPHSGQLRVTRSQQHLRHRALSALRTGHRHHLPPLQAGTQRAVLCSSLTIRQW